MDMTIWLTALATAVSIGLGCGACCSPMISVFLSTYVISHAGGAKKGLWSFISFFLGKILSVTVLCTAAALAGRQFIREDGFIGSFNFRFAAQLVMSALGFGMAVRWYIAMKRQKDACCGCHGCGKKGVSRGALPTFLVGLTYGFTPCAPLLMMMGYAFTLPVPLAGLTGGVFGLSSAASPVLLLSLLSGALSRKMAHEIPKSLKWFQLASYILLMIMPFAVQL